MAVQHDGRSQRLARRSTAAATARSRLLGRR